MIQPSPAMSIRAELTVIAAGLRSLSLYLFSLHLGRAVSLLLCGPGFSL